MWFFAVRLVFRDDFRLHRRYCSTQDAEAEAVVPEPSAPTSPDAAAERAVDQEHGPDAREDVEGGPPDFLLMDRRDEH